MKQFTTILKFELSNYFKSKPYIIVTLLFAVLASVALFSPKFIDYNSMFNSFVEDIAPPGYTEDAGETDNSTQTTTYTDTVLVVSELGETFNTYMTASINSLGYNVAFENFTPEQVATEIEAENYYKALYFESATNYKIYSFDVGMYDFGSSMFYEIIQNYTKVTTLAELGASEEQIGTILYPQITEESIVLGTSQMDSYGYTYVMIFVLYFAVLLYGQMVTMSVVTEKTSKCMELLITSAKPTAFIFAKVFGSGIAGLTQLFVIFGSIVLSYNLNADFWNSVPILSSAFNIPTEIFIYLLIFFICGFFIYAFLFGATASLVSKIEDVSSASTPVMLFFIAQFFVTTFAINSGNFDNVFIQFCSFFPFTSPMVMFSRIAMDGVPIIEIIISVAILLATTGLCGFVAAKIYRAGVLMYGNKPSIGTIIKILKSR